MSNSELLPRLDAAIAAKNLLKHPFYQDWQAGKLSRKALQLYASQYYRHVEAFPQHLRVLAARTDWRPAKNRGRKSGGRRESQRLAPAALARFRLRPGRTGRRHYLLPGPARAPKPWCKPSVKSAADRPVDKAVAALYAYESQVPEIATTKIEGLKSFYGIVSRKPWRISPFTKKPTRPTAPPGATGWRLTRNRNEKHYGYHRTRPSTRYGARSTRCTAPTAAVRKTSFSFIQIKKGPANFAGPFLF